MTLRNSFKLVAVCLLLHSASAWSLGLGDARVESFIGQPLVMRIALLSTASDDLDSVTARLASAEDFALIGANRGAISVPLRFTVVAGKAGEDSYILVTSRLALDDPVLRLVIEVNWSSGRLLREYTVFLDPPTVPTRAPEPVVSAPRRQPESRAEPPAPQPQPAEPASQVTQAPPPPAVSDEEDVSAPESEPMPEPAVEPEVTQAVAAGSAYGPIRNGETLWRIAANYVGQSNMDMNQVMLAIQRRNPDAFMKDNINLLKRGAMLEMPGADEVSEISRARAGELVAQQEAAFRMRSSLASTSTPLLAAESRADTEDSAAASEGSGGGQESASRLEIVPASQEDLSETEPGTGSVPGGEGSEEIDRNLREELARTEEELISERQQNEYLRERISELEAQLSQGEGEDQGLVADESLANLEDRSQSERLSESQAPEPQPAAEESSEPATEMPSVTTSTAEEERSWYSGPVIWIIMVVILVAGAIGWYINRRRGEAYFDEEAEESGATVSGLKGEAEDILRTLEADQAEEPEPESFVRETIVEEAADEPEPEPADEPEPEEATDDVEEAEEKGEARESDAADAGKVSSLQRARLLREDDVADATVLDENSSDPEIKLDLARAYISMGDKEAARVILDEVLSMGSEDQKSEARSMMDEL